MLAWVTKALELYAENRDNPGGGAHGESHGAGKIGIWATSYVAHEVAKSKCTFNSIELQPRVGAAKTLAEAFRDWLDGYEVVLIEGVAGTVLNNPDGCQQKSSHTTCN